MGIYISPGPWTCQQYEGSWQHEQLDAFRFAEWGFDYLKYDWCGYGSLEVWAKKMEDGSTVVGLFNRDEVEKPVTAKWSDLNLKGKVRVRDLWRQKDLGTFEDTFQAPIPRHGVVLIRLSPAAQ
jgi:hypothetical protein